MSLGWVVGIGEICGAGGEGEEVGGGRGERGDGASGGRGCGLNLGGGVETGDDRTKRPC